MKSKMQEKKRIIFKSPDITQMQEVVINWKTKIYIAIGADPEEARSRHLNRPELRGKSVFVRKKPAVILNGNVPDQAALKIS